MSLANTMFKYDSEYGPDIRVGILQEQDTVRLDLSGEYVVTDANGTKLGTLNGSQLEMMCELAKPAELTWHLVAGKATSPEAAEAFAVPEAPEKLSPWQTEELGVGLNSEATAVEYWRCSRPFASKAAVEAIRAKLPNNERLACMARRVQAPEGTVVLKHRDTCMCDKRKTLETLRGNGMLRFAPVDADNNRVKVYDVIVGIEYHWRHLENHRFRGAIEVRVGNDGKLAVVNELPVEQYLFSVNSSEMMSVMPDALLEAQTVAARNTVFATMDKHHHADDFHICADDHCQCYRGSSRETTDSRRLTMSTFAQVLVHNKEICDCRYSKSCGGLMESMDSCWHEDPRGYLPSGRDCEDATAVEEFYPCNTEAKAEKYLHAKPKCWCNTTEGDVPAYLMYTAPYFRWTVKYGREELEQHISRFVGTPIGELKAIEPVKRGDSARLEYIRVIAANGEWVIGKEFNIRKALSATFLYSSAFVPEYDRDAEGRITEIRLVGGGWGHGAGLCQIGATMMAYKGKSFKEILFHYFPNSNLVTAGTVVMGERLQTIIAGPGVDSRVGERCYEYFNCYAVAGCPVANSPVELLARETATGAFDFVAELNGCAMPGKPECCKQLDFHATGATEKK